MSRLGDAAAISAKGGFITVIVNILTLFIGAGNTILVARLLGPSNYGLYIVSLAPASFFFPFYKLGNQFGNN